MSLRFLEIYSNRFLFTLLIALFLFLGGNANLFAQNSTRIQKLDSLIQRDKAYLKEDNEKLDTYIKILIKTYNYAVDKETFINYSSKSIKLAIKLKNNARLADAYHYTGFHYHSLGSLYKAEEFYKLSLQKATEVNYLEGLSSNYLNLAALYNNLSDYSKALDANLAATAIFHKLGDLGSTASCYINIAGIYTSLNQHKTAIAYLDKALKIFTALNNSPYGMGLIYNNLGRSYFGASDEDLKQLGVEKSQRNEKVLNYIAKSLQIATEGDMKSLVVANYDVKGAVSEAMGDKNTALESYKLSLLHAKKLAGQYYVGLSSAVLAKFYERENNLKLAEELAKDALKIGEANKYYVIERDAYEVLSKIAEKQGNFNKALHFYKSYVTSKEKLFNQEKEREITRKQLQLDFGVKEREYQLRQQLTDANLKQQEQVLTLKSQQLALSDKEKTLQRLTFLQKQAELEHDKHEQTNLLKQQQYKSSLDKQLKDKQINLQKTELRFNKNINLFLGILAIILLTSAIVVFFSHRKSVRLNQVVSQQKLELEKLSSVKDRLFSVVSHDMRAPINSLISIIQLLEDGNISQEKLTRYAGLLKNNLGHTSTMMENLLNWASSQMQGFKPLFEPVNVKFCVNDVINTMYTSSKEKNIELSSSVGDNIICYTDANMLSLVLRNLISNAIKFTPNNGNIFISAYLEQSFVNVTIEDTGIGLSLQQIEAVNNSIYTETGKTTRGTNDEKGTGVGLTLCKKFSELMKGKLTAESDGTGSTLTLKLPLYK